MSATIRTNNVPRDLLFYHELSDKEQSEFDYENSEVGYYFRYRGQVYAFGDVLSLRNEFHCPGGQDVLPGWDGYLSLGYDCGLAVKLVDCGDRIVVGYYFG